MQNQTQKEGEKGKEVVVLHQNADLDGRLARWLKQRFSEANCSELIFWGGEPLKNIPCSKTVFLDRSPDKKLERQLRRKGIKLEVIDHHPHQDYPDPDDDQWHLKTTTQMVAQKLNLDGEKISQLVVWSKRADFQSGGDPMNVAKLILEMNRCFPDFAVQGWTEAMLDSLLDEDPDLKQGRQLFLEYLEDFLQKCKWSQKELRRFQERAKSEKVTQDLMNLATQTGYIFQKFGKSRTKTWLKFAFEAIEQGQRRFSKALDQVKEAIIATTGKTVTVIGVSDIPEFGPAARKYIRDIRNTVPIVVQIWPDQRGFQIFSDGYDDLREIAKVLRVEILESRGKEVPNNWRELQKPGTLPDTEPLYYHKARYSVIMWGSLTKPEVPKVDIPENTLRRAILITLDQGYFPDECRKSSECLRDKCSLYSWRLKRCYQVRSAHHQSSGKKKKTLEFLQDNAPPGMSIRME